MGKLEAGRGRYETAIQHLSAVISLVPDDYLVRQELGRIYLKAGQQDQARAEFERYELGVRRHRMRQIAEKEAEKMAEEILGKGESRPPSPDDQ